MYFSTVLFSKEDEGSGDVNPERALEVGTIIQQSLDGGFFTDNMSYVAAVGHTQYAEGARLYV